MKLITVLIAVLTLATAVAVIDLAMGQATPPAATPAAVTVPQTAPQPIQIGNLGSYDVNTKTFKSTGGQVVTDKETNQAIEMMIGTVMNLENQAKALQDYKNSKEKRGRTLFRIFMYTLFTVIGVVVGAIGVSWIINKGGTWR